MLGLLLVLFPVAQAAAQEEVPRIEYDRLYSHTFEEEDGQLFVQFRGAAGELVYVLADYTGYASGDLEVDLRDSIGRSVGFRDEYVFSPFLLAELPGDGLYSVVVTSEAAEEVQYLVGRTGYLEDGVETRLEAESFVQVFGVRASRDGFYELELERQEGSLATDFALINYSETFSPEVVGVNGTEVEAWTTRVRLSEGDRYVAFLDENRIRDRESFAELQLRLQPLDAR